MVEQIPTIIISREEAHSNGMLHYFTGVSCKHGHISKRNVKSDSCLKCASVFQKNWNRKNPDKHKKIQHRSYEKNKPFFIDKVRRNRIYAPYQYAIYRAKERSKATGIEFNLTLEWAKKKWTGKCEITNIPFERNGRKMGCFVASLDRIRPELGYTQSNCRFVLMGFNALKGPSTDEDALRVAKAIVAYFEK